MKVADNLTPNPFPSGKGEPDLRFHTLGSGFEVDALPRVASFRQMLFLLRRWAATTARRVVSQFQFRTKVTRTKWNATIKVSSSTTMNMIQPSRLK